MIELFILLGIVILLPFVIYFCVKFGTAGFFSGKYFAKDFRKKVKE